MLTNPFYKVKFDEKNNLFSSNVIKCTAPISKYIWKETSLDSAMDIIPDDNYILSIQYKAGDVQIGCSGSPLQYSLKYGIFTEDIEKAAIREIGEELGVTTDRFDQTKFGFRDHIFIKSIQHVTPLPNKPRPKRCAGKDDKSKKAFMLLYGSETDMIDLLGKLETVLPSKDYPFAVAAIPKRIATICVNEIRMNPPKWNDFTPLNWEKLCR